MSIEIRELVIRATVEGGEAKQQQNAGQGQGDGVQENQQQIIEECVAQVLKILQRKDER
jgi:transposase